MTKDEYDKTYEIIENERKDKIRLFKITYAMSNCSIERGDMVEDNSERILIEDIKCHIPFHKEYPECCFFGPRYTRKMKPYKNNDVGRVSQLNIIKHIKKEDLKVE